MPGLCTTRNMTPRNAIYEIGPSGGRYRRLLEEERTPRYPPPLGDQDRRRYRPQTRRLTASFTREETRPIQASGETRSSSRSSTSMRSPSNGPCERSSSSSSTASTTTVIEQRPQASVSFAMCVTPTVGAAAAKACRVFHAVGVTDVFIRDRRHLHDMSYRGTNPALPPADATFAGDGR